MHLGKNGFVVTKYRMKIVVRNDEMFGYGKEECFEVVSNKDETYCFAHYVAGCIGKAPY